MPSVPSGQFSNDLIDNVIASSPNSARIGTAMDIRPVALAPEFTKFNTRRATPDTLGAGIARSTQAIAQGLADVGQAIGSYNQMKADARAAEATNKLKGEIDSHLYNPSDSYLNTSGSAAMDG